MLYPPKESEFDITASNFRSIICEQMYTTIVRLMFIVGLPSAETTKPQTLSKPVDSFSFTLPSNNNAASTLASSADDKFTSSFSLSMPGQLVRVVILDLLFSTHFICLSWRSLKTKLHLLVHVSYALAFAWLLCEKISPWFASANFFIPSRGTTA